MLQQIALVSESAAVGLDQLAEVAAALQKQVVRDFGPIWDVQATVSPFPTQEAVPEGYSRVTIADALTERTLGFHRTRDGQPFAMVLFREDWPRIASHEVLEMLADPSGDRLVPGDSPDPAQGRVEFLLEVCDPCAPVTYPVNGLDLSDFFTPDYHSPVAAAGVRYSFTGQLAGPREVVAGGYLSWRVPGTNDWFVAVRSDSQLTVQPIPGPITGLSLREVIDRQARPPEATPKRRRARPGPPRESATRKRLKSGRAAAAARFREEVAALATRPL